MPAPLVFCPCWHQGVQTPSGKALPSLRAPACQLLSLPVGQARGSQDRRLTCPRCHTVTCPPWQGHTLGLALSPASLAGRRPTSRIQSALALWRQHRRHPCKPCCQETVSLDSDSLRRQHCGGGRVPSTPSQSGEWLVLGSRRWGGPLRQDWSLGTETPSQLCY